MRLGILYFAGGKSHIVPGIGGKQRANLRDRQDGQRAHQHRRAADAHLHCMLCAQPRIPPEVPVEIGQQGLGIASDKNTHNHESEKRRSLGDGENVLDQGPGLEAEDIDD